VGGADEAPFALDGRHAPAGEAPVAAIGLDVAEDGLDDDFAALEGSAWIGWANLSSMARRTMEGSGASPRTWASIVLTRPADVPS
jgi:hypothetical protein